MGRTTVTLCGSTRFSEAFQKAMLEETLAGKIVLSIGCDMRSDDEIFAKMDDQQKTRTKEELDRLHLDKIERSDEILVLNVGGYVGQSTAREIAHAMQLGKRVRYLRDTILYCEDCDTYVGETEHWRFSKIHQGWVHDCQHASSATGGKVTQREL